MTSSDNGAPLIAIGLAPPDCPPNVMVGSWPQSIGLYSDGNIIVNSRWSNNLSNIFMKPGDTIGALVRLAPADKSSRKSSYTDDTDDSDDEYDFAQSYPYSAMLSLGRMLGMSSSSTRKFPPVESVTKEDKLPLNICPPPFVVFNVNGSILQFPESVDESLAAEVKFNPPLYPTVSLMSENTKVWCRFDRGDIVSQSRHSIGAPSGVKVYCLDGTLLLGEKDE
jgi:hypothetical protein